MVKNIRRLINSIVEVKTIANYNELMEKSNDEKPDVFNDPIVPTLIYLLSPKP